MSRSYHLEDCRITLARQGAREYTKISYPVRSGAYSEIDARDFTFHFNLNQEIIRAAGKGANWPHPHEWLKRTMGNDWVYYSTGGYTGVFETTGEYYLPNLPYPTNSYMGGKPLLNARVAALTDNWYPMIADLEAHLAELPIEVKTFFHGALVNTPKKLAQKADMLFHSCGGRVSVLPPDTRHVDYNVIPLTIARGCLYKCRFCKVKSSDPFVELTHSDISDQLDRLCTLYRNDLANYNGLFLGEHDALQASPNLICCSITEAYDRLGLLQSYIRGANVFLFGSVTSLLSAPSWLFKELDTLPGNIYINIGLESADQQTLDLLGKPIVAGEVVAAFKRMQEINDSYASIEVTGNFVIDDNLSAKHYQSLLALVRDSIMKSKDKGCIYLSPMSFDAPSRAKLFEFYRLKVLSRLPLFLYVIQRL